MKAKVIYYLNAIAVALAYFSAPATGNGGIEAFSKTIAIAAANLGLAVLLMFVWVLLELLKKKQAEPVAVAIKAFALSAGICFLVSFPMCLAK